MFLNPATLANLPLLNLGLVSIPAYRCPIAPANTFFLNFYSKISIRGMAINLCLFFFCMLLLCLTIMDQSSFWGCCCPWVGKTILWLILHITTYFRTKKQHFLEVFVCLKPNSFWSLIMNGAKFGLIRGLCITTSCASRYSIEIITSLARAICSICYFYYSWRIQKHMC